MAEAKHSGLPADSQVTRRNLVVAAPAVGLAALLTAAVPVEAMTETPVMALFRQWKIAHEVENKTLDKSNDWDDAECTSAREARARIEALLMEEPCRNAGDFAYKVMAWTAYGAFAMPDESENPTLWAEARALVGA